MPDRHSVRRLLLTIVLSQAMVIQVLLVAWSSTQAAAGAVNGLSTSICSSTISSGGTEPGQSGAPHDCFSACLAAQMDAPPDLTVLLPYDTTYARISASRQAELPAIELQLAFSARAPPTLT